MEQHYYIKNEEEEKETNNNPPPHHHHHHPNATETIFMSYSLSLPGSAKSVVRCEVIYDKIDDEQDYMVFRNCVLMSTMKTVIDTYVTLNPIGFGSSSSSSHGVVMPPQLQVFKAAMFSTSIKRFHDSCCSRTTSVYDTFFVVKAVDENILGSILNAREEVRRNMAAMEGERHHKNLLRVKACFMDKPSGKLCVVMPFPGHSLRTVMKKAFPGGFPEDLILSVLRSVLDALGFLHTQSIFHTDINAGHVYLGQSFWDVNLRFEYNHEINLGFAATVYDDDDDDEMENTLPYLPVASMSNWAAAPEVYNGNQPYSDKADIWLLGITALELAFGGLKVPNRNALEAIINDIHDKKKLPIPISGKNLNNYEEGKHDQEANNNMFKYLLQPFSSSNAAWDGDGDELLVPLCSSSPYDEESLTMLPNCPSSSSSSNDNDNEDYYCSFSETFTDMVMKCLAWDPEKRPGFNELMSHNFFTQDRGRLDGYYLYEEVMKQWPPSSS